MREQLLEEEKTILTMDHLKAEQTLMQKKRQCMEEELRFERLKEDTIDITRVAPRPPASGQADIDKIYG